jgi:hypothetical protein
MTLNLPQCPGCKLFQLRPDRLEGEDRYELNLGEWGWVHHQRIECHCTSCSWHGSMGRILRAPASFGAET